MGRKIEIEVSENLYSDLLKEAQGQGYNLQQYIELKMNEGIKGKGLQAAKKLIVKELQNTINRIEALRPEELETEDKSNRILVYSYQSLMQQSITLPQELEDRIALFREREWLEERLFYLIVSRKKPVGMIGILPQQEPMPYGDYLHIYGLYLEKDLQTKKNLAYMAGYIQAIAKQEKALNVDISNTATNIPEHQLKEMGFHSFSTSWLMKGMLKDRKEVDNSRKATEEVIELKGGLLQEYILSERILPIRLLVKGWEKRESSIEAEKISLQLQASEAISYILIKERLLFNESAELRLNILVKPIGVYDPRILEEIYIDALTKAAAEGEEATTVICLPEELKALESKLKTTSTIEIKWYRSLINGS